MLYGLNKASFITAHLQKAIAEVGLDCGLANQVEISFQAKEKDSGANQA